VKQVMIGGMLVILAMLAGACTGLGGEPQIVATVAPRAASQPVAQNDTSAPDLLMGQALFLENCTECHGPQGRGDGPLVLNQQLDYVPDMTDPSQAIAQTPAEYFDVVTNGRLEKIMPPWRGSMSDAERWAVSMYAYMLRFSQGQVAMGQALWAMSCADCHGPVGAGDGPDAAPGMINLTRLVETADISDAAWWQRIREGDAPRMPAYDGSDAEIDALVAYARSLSLGGLGALPMTRSAPDAAAAGAAAAMDTTDAASQAEATAEATEEATSEVLTTITLGGTVTNASDGGALAAGVPVVLHIIQQHSDAGTFSEEIIETTSGDDGTFVFADAPLFPERIYLVTAESDGGMFSGTPQFGADLSAEVPLDVAIYEFTQDPGVITVNRIITQMERLGDSVQVLQVFGFTNSADRVFGTSQINADGGLDQTSVSIQIPEGAVLTPTQDIGQRLTVSEDGRTITDTRAVFPNADHSFMIAYEMPIGDTLLIELALDYALEGDVEMLAIGVEPVNFDILREETFGSVTLPVYGQAGVSQPAGEPLQIEVQRAEVDPALLEETGAEQIEPLVQPTSSAIDVPLVAGILLGLGGLLLIGGAFVYWRNSRQGGVDGPDDAPDAPEADKPKRSDALATPEADKSKRSDAPVSDPVATAASDVEEKKLQLIRQIAELDARFEAGDIARQDYETLRGLLKERLADVMRQLS
jgi:mono/diheme cytochrome c family protein